MKGKIFSLFKFISRIFRKKKRITTNKVNYFPKKLTEINIPNYSHYPSLGIHRIRDTP
jgi:hypothetical protein